jgi:hypothetical protein
MSANGKPSRRDTQRREIEAWWALFLRMVFALLGMMIVAHQAFVVEEQSRELIIAGLGLCGPYVATSVAAIWRGPSEGKS